MDTRKVRPDVTPEQWRAMILLDQSTFKPCGNRQDQRGRNGQPGSPDYDAEQINTETFMVCCPDRVHTVFPGPLTHPGAIALILAPPISPGDAAAEQSMTPEEQAAQTSP